MSRKVDLLRGLTSVRLADCNTVDEYVSKIVTSVHKLKELQFEIIDKMIAALLLSGLPEIYKPMIMGLESSGTALTADAVKVKMLQEVQVVNADSNADPEAALYTKIRKGQYREYKAKKCFVCNKPGHFAAKCRYRSRNKQPEREQIAFIAIKSETKDMEWYLDSCASSHMTHNEEWLKGAREVNSSVITAGCGKLEAHSKGEVQPNIRIHNQRRKIEGGTICTEAGSESTVRQQDR